MSMSGFEAKSSRSFICPGFWFSDVHDILLQIQKSVRASCLSTLIGCCIQSSSSTLNTDKTGDGVHIICTPRLSNDSIAVWITPLWTDPEAVGFIPSARCVMCVLIWACVTPATLQQGKWKPCSWWTIHVLPDVFTLNYTSAVEWVDDITCVPVFQVHWGMSFWLYESLSWNYVLFFLMEVKR